MKQAWYRHHRGNRRVLAIVALVMGLLLLGVFLTSCNKQADKAETKAQDQGWTMTSEPAQSIPGRAVQKSMGTKCESNLQQLRELITMAKTDNGDESYPASLADIPEASRISKCPISKNPYEYDPTTGKVHCTFSGHENF